MALAADYCEETLQLLCNRPAGEILLQINLIFQVDALMGQLFYYVLINANDLISMLIILLIIEVFN